MRWFHAWVRTCDSGAPNFAFKLNQSSGSDRSSAPPKASHVVRTKWMRNLIRLDLAYNICFINKHIIINAGLPLLWVWCNLAIFWPIFHHRSYIRHLPLLFCVCQTLLNATQMPIHTDIHKVDDHLMYGPVVHLFSCSSSWPYNGYHTKWLLTPKSKLVSKFCNKYSDTTIIYPLRMYISMSARRHVKHWKRFIAVLYVCETYNIKKAENEQHFLILTRHNPQQ